MFTPGAFNWQATVQQRSTTRGTAGGVDVTWSDVETISVERVSDHGREFLSAKARHAQTQIVFRMWYREDLTSPTAERDHRIVFEGRNYQILFVAEEVYRTSHLVACRFTEGRP